MKKIRLRILLCANACRPDSGSEAGVGWLAYQTLRKKHQVRVLCSAASRDAIEKAVEAGRARAEDFVFIPEKWKYTGQLQADRLISWLNVLAYQSHLARLGEAQIKEFRPDCIHHVTIATWRTGNALAGFAPPFVWGPIGGGESLPMAFLGGFSTYSKAFEILRAISGRLSRLAFPVKKTARTANYIFASNRETFELVARIRGNRARMEILPVVFFSSEKMLEFRESSLRTSDPEAPIQIFSGGYLEARKGIGLALQALAKLKKRGFAFRYEHGGIGPEQGYLTKQIRDAGLEDCASILKPYGGEAYANKLRATHIFLFPSLRDNCPVTLLEAMGHGCVPVVADHAGPGEIVTPECGIKIPVTRPAEFVDRLAKELEGLFEDAALRARLGRASHERVLKAFGEARWLSRVEQAYSEVVAGSPGE